jgi:amidase
MTVAHNRHPNDPADDASSLTRRDAVKLTAGALAGVALVACQREPVSSSSTRALAEPLYNSSAMAIAAAIRAGEVSASEVTNAFLTRIEEVNSQLNAVVQLRADEARSEARRADDAIRSGDPLGPLHGVPMTIKDSLDTAGMVSTGGLVGRAAFVPPRDATVVQRLRQAGAILLGKTNTPELTLAYETDNGVYGRTSNPWDLDRTTGGSSGGAGAILAAGGSAFDIGSDYGGSIRIPAHFNGIAGLKPTHGRVSRAGHILPYGGTHDSFQQIGPMARYVDDLAPLLRIIAGPDNVDPAVVPMPLADPDEVDLSALRVAFYTNDGISDPTGETQTVVTTAANALAGTGASVEEGRPPGLERAFGIGLRFYIGAATTVRANRIREAAGQATPGIASGNPLEPSALDQLFEDWYTVRHEMTSFFNEHDVILCPVSTSAAPLHGNTAIRDFSYSVAYNVTGWPAGVVRAGTSAEGLPLGVQIVAAPSREDRVLAVARFLEQELGGFAPPTGLS